MRIIILGAGRIGSAMVQDLARDSRFNLAVADRDEAALQSVKNLVSETICLDLSDVQIVKNIVKDFDLVIDAVPGFMGYQTFKAVIESGKDIVDIAFFPEDPFDLDELAKKNDVTAIMDCGVAPGMSNLLVGYVDHLLDNTENAEIFVGGLPKVREWPYEYRAVFSPIDVIEEYTRPARYVENGVLVTRPALSDPELLFFPGVGTLEAFNTDGLRTLAETIESPNMKEKTMRYPGHIEKMAVLRQTGFFDQTPIDINGTAIRPLDFTSRLLFPQWEMKPGDEDITVMRVTVEGKLDGEHIKYSYDLLDHFDVEGNVSSMARTTGYTATVAVRMIADGIFKRKGVCPPEYIGQKEEATKYMLNGLAERGIEYRETIETKKK